MKLGQILDILEKRYSSEVLGELHWDESSKRERDREEIIRVIWNGEIVPKVVKIQEKDTTIHQRVGLYHYLRFQNRSDKPDILAKKIGISHSLIKQFNSTKDNHLPYNLANNLYKKYIGHLANRTLNITIESCKYKGIFYSLSCAYLKKPLIRSLS